MIKKLLISILVGTLFYFSFGWLIFDFILGSYTELNTNQLISLKKTGAHLSLVFLFVSCVAYATLISFVLIYLANIKSLQRGFLIASIIGSLIAMMTDFYWYATSNFYWNFTVVICDIIGAAVAIGCMGLVITFLNKKMA